MSDETSRLQQLVAVCDIIWEVLGGENLVLVVDTEKVLFARDGTNTRFNLKAGDPVRPQWVTSRALNSGKRVVDYVAQEQSTFGFPYAAMAVPVFVNRHTVGAFTVTSMLNKQQEIRAHAETLASSAGQLTESSDHISSSASQLAAYSSQMETTLNDILKNVGAVEDAISLIQDVAEQTNLLGLNAAIEAARAAEAGRGFNVVANEIRKLASKVQENAQSVSVSLSSMVNGVKESAKQIVSLNSVAQDQADTLEKVSATIHRLEEGIGALEKLSKESWL